MGNSDPSENNLFTTAALGTCPNGDAMVTFGLSSSGAALGPEIQQLGASQWPAGVSGSYSNGVFTVRGPESALSGIGSVGA